MAHHITKTISNGAYWTINKQLHRQLGLRTTLLLQHFIDLQTKLFGNNEFYQSYTQIQDELVLTEHHIKDSIRILKEKGIVSVEKKGMPAKNHYFVLLGKVEELLSLDSEKSPNKSEIPQSVEIQPTSEVIFTEQDSGISPNKSSEMHSTNKRINNKTIKEKELKKELTGAAVSERNILNRLLDDLIQYDNPIKFKRSWNDIVDYGGLNKVYDVLEFDSSQINNWNRKIWEVKSFVNG